ncbi:MAG TPA: 4a-hydroxytetrahydrobiopterin dehydratase [Gemmatimonadaceae bacterium]|jgi:4a-hydroxytetrahydrobiopterin dehydratase|nr:4a-hydroxytetrahydrobiopterin dehydratase [Gemmatimonadaceae bacterium]
MAKQPLLSDIDIQRRLGALPGWTRRGDAITKVFTFRGFPEAVAFVDTLVAPAEQMNHHPDIDVRYNKVIITLSTHDSGGLTLNDLSLAEKIDAVGGGA